MGNNKFSIGDKVLIVRNNGRTPQELINNLRLEIPRTIKSIYYDSQSQHNRYYLGTNNLGNIDLSCIHFRASELKLWEKGARGRPKEKRRYILK